MQTSIGVALAFGRFQLFPLQRIVLCDGASIRLGSRAREILLALVEHAGEVVKKRELIQRVWPETIVEEATLRVHISALRKALGDGQSGMRYVENITGVGYRFVAPVHLVEQAAPAQHEHTETAEPAYNILGLQTGSRGTEQVVFTLGTRAPLRRRPAILDTGGIAKSAVAKASIDQLRESHPNDLGRSDDTDLTPSRLMAESSTRSYSEPARDLDLSSRVVHDGMQCGEQDGEIERFTVASEAASVGKPLLAFVHVDATSWDLPRQLLRLNELADVWEIHRVAGESAIILKVRTRDAHGLEALLDGIHTIDGLRSTRTYIVLSTYRDSGSNLVAE